MNNDERIFDFLAAAEDTGRQLDELLKALPGEMRAILAAEYRQSPWLTTLPETADRVTAAAERAEAAAGLLTRKAKVAGFFVCAVAIAVPLLTWAYAYWQTKLLFGVRNDLQYEIKGLQNTARLLIEDYGGGATLYSNDAGEYVFTLPPGLFFTESPLGATSVTYKPIEK